MTSEGCWKEGFKKAGEFKTDVMRVCRVFGVVRPALVKWMFLAIGISLLLMFVSSIGSRPTSLEHRLHANSNCTAHRSIVFLKTHKCASTTVQNILMRYGEKHNLNFVLGNSANYLGSPYPFKRGMIGNTLWPSSGLFNIFCLHTRLDINAVRSVMYPDAKWVTILRDPVSLFESGYEFYQLWHPTQWNITIQQFSKLSLEDKRKLPRKTRVAGNQMTFDLGFDPDQMFGDPAQIGQMIDTVEKNFHLVMIAEMMDESLVLLQRTMCWNIDDVVYMTRNARRDQFKAKLTSEETKLLREFLAVDQQLYDHFLKRLAARIQEEVPDTIVAQAETLVARRLQVQSRCLSEEVSDQGKLPKGQREYSGHVHVYRTRDPTDWTCSRINMPELTFVDLVRNQQRERLSVWRRTDQLLKKTLHRNSSSGRD